MKTKNYVQFTTMRTLLIIAFFAFIGISVHAQDIWKFIREFDSESENKVSISGERNLSKFPINNNSLDNTIYPIFNEVKEEKLKLEDWMLDENNFDVQKKTSFNSLIDEEPKLKLEDWMIDERNFEVKPQREENLKYAGTNYPLHNISNKKFRLEK